MQISHMKHGINKPSLTHTNTETKGKAKMTKHQINKDIKNVVNGTNVAEVQQIFGHTHTQSSGKIAVHQMMNSGEIPVQTLVSILMPELLLVAVDQ